MTDHDSSYKLLFSHACMVEDLLRGFVGEAWVTKLDFSTLEKVNGIYVSDDLRQREDDLIWRVRSQGEWLYIYLLLEFQSTVDPWMALRIMVYTGLLYQDLIKSGQIKGHTLPPVFPIVLYNGRQRWTAARDVSELIAPLPGGLSGYRPAQRYHLLEETAVPEAQLSDEQNTVTSVIRLETSQEPADVSRVLTGLIKRLQGPEFHELRRAFTIWINRSVLTRVLPQQEIPEVSELQEMNTMLAERVDEWTERWKQEGLQKGPARRHAARRSTGAAKTAY